MENVGAVFADCLASLDRDAKAYDSLSEQLSTIVSEMDGNWAALLAASDGKVYAGPAYHGGNGHQVYYDSKADRLVDAGDLTRLSGESNLRRGPQSKIYAKFGEGKDGRIYFGTHAGFWWDYSRFATKEGYPGARWMAFDPAAGRVEGLGLGVPNEGTNTGAYDPVFNRIYGLTLPRGHFVYYDVASRKNVDKGRINNWESICRTLGIDDEGNVYGSFGAGQVWCYDPRTDTIRELAGHTTIQPKGISFGRDYYKSESAWRTVVWDRHTRKYFGVDESATLLFSFDPRAGSEGEVSELGQLCSRIPRPARCCLRHTEPRTRARREIVLRGGAQGGSITAAARPRQPPV